MHGGLRYKETCLKVNFTDKTRELVCKYEGYEINGQELIIKLKDEHYDFAINLHYRGHYDYDLMERWVEIVNNTEDQILVEKIYSAQFHIPYEGINFSNTHGHWGAEQQRFTQKMSFGKVVIENHIKLNKRLETVDISSALGRYIVSQHYIDDDANTYVFEFEDARTNNQLVFNSYDEFVKYASQVGNYVLFMDKKNKVDLCGMLIVGSTGSGKTYAVYTLILTMLNWKIKPNIYFADPKNSSLVVLGNAICPEKTAGTIEDIISLLERFHDEMQNRKIEMQDKLNEKLDADYRYWNMPANIFVFDEFAAFQSVIDSMDKKTRDHVSMLLRNIVLEGRQLGYFAALIMQKSDATDLKSSIRANLPWVVVLGNATRTTYLTAFEETADLPNRNFRRGEGLFSYQGVTRQPQITSCIYRPDRAHCTAL